MFYLRPPFSIHLTLDIQIYKIGTEIKCLLVSVRKVILKTTLCYRHILLSIKDGSKFANEMDMLIHLYIKIKTGLNIVIT